MKEHSTSRPLSSTQTLAKPLHDFRRLCGRRLRGAIQTQSGEYLERIPISDAMLDEHLAGDVSIALSCVRSGIARFAAVDIDDRAAERLPRLVAAFERRGLVTVATNGSAPNRAKLVAFFAFVQPQHAVLQLLDDVVAEALGADRDQIDLRPTAGEGGLLRLTGRNRARNGPLEFWFDPKTGEKVELCDVPVNTIELVDGIDRIAKSPLQPWVYDLIAGGMRWPSDGNKTMTKIRFRLASEALRVYGPQQGFAKFMGWIEQIRTTSPDLERESPKNQDDRHPLRQELCSGSWLAAVRRRETLHRQAELGKTDQVVSRTLQTIVAYVRERGLNPMAFELSYREIARVLSVSPQTAHRWVQHTVDAGHITIHDRGTQGARGLKTIYGIVRSRESWAGESHWAVQLRKARVARLSSDRSTQDPQRATAAPERTAFVRPPVAPPRRRHAPQTGTAASNPNLRGKVLVAVTPGRNHQAAPDAVPLRSFHDVIADRVASIVQRSRDEPPETGSI